MGEPIIAEEPEAGKAEEPTTLAGLEQRMILLQHQSHTILYLCAVNLFVNVVTIVIAIVLAV